MTRTSKLLLTLSIIISSESLIAMQHDRTCSSSDESVGISKASSNSAQTTPAYGTPLLGFKLPPTVLPEKPNPIKSKPKKQQEVQLVRNIEHAYYLLQDLFDTKQLTKETKQLLLGDLEK